MADSEIQRASFAYVRQQIEDQQGNLQERVSWHVLAEAFLLSAYATVLATSGSGSSGFAAMSKVLYWILPAAGLAIFAATYVSLVAGARYLTLLRKRYRRSGARTQLEELIPIEEDPRLRALGHLFTMALPPIFGLLWLGVLIAQLSLAWLG